LFEVCDCFDCRITVHVPTHLRTTPQNITSPLQMSPVNEYVGPTLEKIFAPFVEQGYLVFVYGGVEVGLWQTLA